MFDPDLSRPDQFDSGDPDEGAQGNSDKIFERALEALQRLLGSEVVACVAGVGAPDHGLVLGGYLRAGEEVAEHNRHFAGESMLFRIEDLDGRMIGCFVVDEEVLWGEECWLDVDGMVKLRLGNIDLFVRRGDFGEWYEQAYG